MELGYTLQDLKVGTTINVCFSDGWYSCKVVGGSTPEQVIIRGNNRIYLIHKAEKEDKDLGVSEFAAKHHAYYVRHNNAPKLLVPTPIKNSWIMCTCQGVLEGLNIYPYNEPLFFIYYEEFNKLILKVLKNGNSSIMHSILKNKGLTDYIPDEIDCIWHVPALSAQLQEMHIPYYNLEKYKEVKSLLIPVRDPLTRWISMSNMFINSTWHSYMAFKLFHTTIESKEDIWNMAAWLPQFMCRDVVSMDAHFAPQHLTYKLFMDEYKKRTENEDPEIEFVDAKDLTLYWEKEFNQPFYISNRKKKNSPFKLENISKEAIAYVEEEIIKKDIEFYESVKPKIWVP